MKIKQQKSLLVQVIHNNRTDFYMRENLQCFISASYETDVSVIRNVLAEYDINTVDLYDFSIGDSIQQILKRKIRQSDFAIFIVSDSSSLNVVYEMGVCEGMGKQYFVFIENGFKIPFYLENQLFFRNNLNDRAFLKAAVEKIIRFVSRKDKPTKQQSSKQLKESKKYSNDVKLNLKSYIDQIKNLREIGSGRELEYIVEEIFKVIQLPYVENQAGRDTGVDFALWNDELGKILGNPMIVEVKYGSITSNRFHQAEEQINKYVEKADAKVALLLYLDREGRRYKVRPSLSPLIISYDVEDFASYLLEESFESLILAQRNKIAHGID